MKPWLETWTHERGVVFIKGDCEHVCLANAGDHPIVNRSPEAMARMQLASAAPEMVEALLVVEHAIENYVDMAAGNPRGAKHIDAAMAKIDGALTRAGLTCKRSRDEARKAIAERAR